MHAVYRVLTKVIAVVFRVGFFKYIYIFFLTFYSVHKLEIQLSCSGLVKYINIK